MLSDEILKKELEKANNNVYISDDIKDIVNSPKSDSLFNLLINTLENSYMFKILQYENKDSLKLFFNANSFFVFDLVMSNIQKIEVVLNDSIIKTIITKNSLFYYKISLTKNNSYSIELEILKENKDE